MNREKYPDYFLLGMLLYLIVLVIGLYFITSAIEYGLVALYYESFLLITTIILLPLVFYIIYFFTPRIRFLWGREKWIRVIINILIIISILFVSVMFVPLMF